MSWVFAYRARTTNNDIEFFVNEANNNTVNLSKTCENYYWEVKDKNVAQGFTKIAFSLFPKRDFLKILKEIQTISNNWQHIKIEVADDYVLGDWCNIHNIDISKLDL